MGDLMLCLTSRYNIFETSSKTTIYIDNVGINKNNTPNIFKYPGMYTK